MSEVGISRFRWTDIPAALTIERESFTTEAWSAESFWSELATGQGLTFLAARAEGHMVGYAIGVSDGDDTHVHTVAVGSAYRRQGVGSRLVNDLLDDAAQRRSSRVLLEVAKDNDAAVALYGRLGFRELAVRDDYYGVGKPALILAMDVQVAHEEVACD